VGGLGEHQFATVTFFPLPLFSFFNHSARAQVAPFDRSPPKLARIGAVPAKDLPFGSLDDDDLSRLRVQTPKTKILGA